MSYLTDKLHIQFKQEDLITDNQLLDIIGHRIKNKEPFSMARVGDGELIIMSQEILLSQEYISQTVGWSNSFSYCGVSTPDIETRDKLINAIKTADVVGVFPNDDFMNRMFSALDFKPETLCYAFINVYLCYNKLFVQMIKENPPLLIGGKSELFAKFIQDELGVKAKGYYTDIKCPSDIEKTVDYMNSVEHDWSLVSAGVNAKIISNIMAKQHGKVCVDSGQMFDTLLDVEKKYNGRYYFAKD
jgi:hypothetical protein